MLKAVKLKDKVTDNIEKNSCNSTVQLKPSGTAAPSEPDNINSPKLIKMESRKIYETEEGYDKDRMAKLFQKVRSEVRLKREHVTDLLDTMIGRKRMNFSLS